MATLQDSFKQTLDDFKGKLRPGEEAMFAGTSLNDLELAVKDIQERQRKSKTAQNLKRIEPFLQAMAQYKEIIEVFLNASSLLCFVWGPMKFMLMIASNWSKSFDILLDTYKQIAENFPLLLKYRSMFSENDHMKKVLVWIYEDILKFHLRAWRVFAQPAWKQLFNATWKDFQECFKPIQNDLVRHRELIESTANLEQIQESRDAQLQAQAAFAQFEREQKHANRLAVVNWLSAADAGVDHDVFISTRTEFPETGGWILKEPKITAWFDMNDSSVPMFWLNGKPGAGKTILASVVIEEALKNKNPKSAVSIAFFYCIDQDAKRNRFPGVAKAMIAQLLDQNPSILPFLVDECAKKVLLSSPRDCARVLSTVLQAVPKTWIIIDGIDECEPKERKAILDFFTSAINNEDNEEGKLRGFFISQDLGDIRTALHDAQALKLTEEHSALDIRSYTNNWSFKIQKRFENMPEPLPEVAREHIVKLVCEGADGMFLFAKLVMANLHGQKNLENLYKELNPDTFPHGFDQAYSRIVKRVFDNTDPGPQRIAKELIGWIACAKRPLKWHEIQGATCIDIEQGVVNFKSRQLPEDVRELCGSLVEIYGERVQLVHTTARRYLLENKWINGPEEETKLALLCLRYLTFECFEASLGYQAMLDFVKNGSYAFLDYASLHWNHHLETALHTLSISDLRDSSDLATALNEFFEIYEPGPMQHNEATKKYVHRFASVEAADSYEPAILLLCEAHAKRLEEEKLDALGPLGRTIAKVRAILEEQSSVADEAIKQLLRQFYGQNWHKCSRHACYYFHEGFANERGLLQHTNKHEKPFCCTEMGCTRMYIGWGTEKELKKHMSLFHPDPEAFSWKFPHVKKPPTTFQCKECPKTYTRSSSLKTHTLREHAKVKSFTCKTCGKGFVRKFECQRHESIHLDKGSKSSQTLEEEDNIPSPMNS